MNWRKVVITPPPGLSARWNSAEFVRFSQDIADKIYEATGHAALYFAKYHVGGRPETMRIEVQVRVAWPLKKFRQLLEDKSEDSLNVTNVEKTQGSFPHAQAYLLSRQLRAGDAFLLKDTVHWLFNMVGHGYVTEIKMYCESAACMAANLEGLQ